MACVFFGDLLRQIGRHPGLLGVSRHRSELVTEGPKARRHSLLLRSRLISQFAPCLLQKVFSLLRRLAGDILCLFTCDTGDVLARPGRITRDLTRLLLRDVRRRLVLCARCGDVRCGTGPRTRLVLCGVTTGNSRVLALPPA
jgi:hypothetical protein